MPGPSPEARAIVLRRAALRCERCDEPVGRYGHLHHRRLKGIGGSKDPATNAPSNLLLTCPSCHRWIHAEPAKAYERGLLVHSYDDPSIIPVMLRHGLVLLDDEGGWRLT